MHRLLPIVALLLLAACSGRGPIDDDPTLAALEARVLDIRPAPLPPMPRHDARQSYEALSQDTRNDALKAMALQRLADIELDTPPAEAASESADTSTPAGTAANAADLDEAAGDANVASAIDQYQRLLELYPDYAGNDQVLYQLARAYDFNGELDKTLTTLDRLIAAYPDIGNRDEIEFRRGEINFAFRNFSAAENAYQYIVARGPDSPYYDRALFKHGWAVFKQGDTQRSLHSYFGVLDRSFANGRQLADFSRSERELLDDTLRIISLSFSYLKGAESVDAFFDDYGRRDQPPLDYAFRIYQRLGEFYLNQGRVDDAAGAFQAFVERSPTHRQAPLFLVREIEIYKQAGRLEEVLRAKADLVTAYGIGTAFWQTQSDPELLTRLIPHLKNNLQDLARYAHAQAQKSGKAADYRIAAHWYRRYVESFPEDPQTPAMHMLLAESLLDSGDTQAAAQAFEITAYGYPPHDKQVEAGYAALLAHRALADKLATRTKSDKRMTTQYKQQQRATIAIAKRFVSYFSDDPRANTIMSKAAEELLALKDYPQAVASAWYVVSSQPEAAARLRHIDWGIIAVGEFELGLYAESEQASLQRLQLTGARDPQRQASIERLAAAIYKQGEQARAEGLHGAAARHFLRVGELAPTASIRANAVYDAAAELIVKQDWTLAIPVLKVFVSRYPSHTLTPDAYQKLALAYEKTGDWRRTAETYQVLYDNETNSERKRLILWQTAEFYEKANRQLDAAEIYKKYIRTFRQPYDDQVEAHIRLANIYKERHDRNSRRYWLGKLVALDAAAAAAGAGVVTARSQYLAATASLELAQEGFDAYNKIRLVQPLKKNLKEKKRLMKASIDAYTKAADYGIESVTTASTYRIAEIYSGFGRDLMESERPKGLNEEELEQYEILLEDQAYPFEEKAIEVHTLNATRAFDGTYDDWVKKSFDALKKLSPFRYDKPETYQELINVIQ